MRINKTKQMKTINLIHKEHNEECFEILKSTIVEDRVINKYRIDKDTLLHKLPEKIVNEFLDFIGSDDQHRSLMLYMIKSGTLIIECWDDDEESSNSSKIHLRNKKSNPIIDNKGKYDDTFDYPSVADLPF